MFRNYAKTDLQLMISNDEKILWHGKPNKCCFILEGIFNPFLPFAIIWAIIDLLVLFSFSNTPPIPDIAGIPVFFSFIPFIFILFHMLPVWIYLGGIFFIFRKYKHTEYIITDKNIYISGGLFSYTCKMKPFAELARVSIHRGIIDQIIGVGDVVLISNNADDLSSSITVGGKPIDLGIRISDIRDYREVFNIIKKLQEDIYTDTM